MGISSPRESRRSVHRQRGRSAIVVTAAFLLIAGVAAAWLLRSGGPDTAASASRGGAATPVIIYLIDTLRADRLGLYGYTRRATSPRMDALAADSVVFDQAYSAAPWTLPSVASLITSTYSCEHNVTRDTNRLNPSLPTLAQRMAEMGYATASFYGNGYAGEIADLDRGYQVAEKRTESNERAADVRQFIAQAGRQPFLLYLHTMEPHQPFSVDAKFINRFGHASLDDRENYRATWHLYRELRAVDWASKQPLGTTDNTTAQEQAMAYLQSLRPTVDLVYDAAVASADEHLGQVIDVLKENGIWEHALFIVLADHGEEFGEHHGWTHGQSVYEELVHVPMLVHFPGGEHGGRRVRESVSLVDVVPTIFDYLGRTDLCKGCRGQSLLPHLGGASAPHEESRLEPLPQERLSFVPTLRINEQHYFRPWKEHRGDVNVVVREDGWKAIWNAEHGATELYDLAADREERDDVAAQHPGRAERLASQAQAWYAACRRGAVTPVHRELAPRAKEELRALGYIN